MPERSWRTFKSYQSCIGSEIRLDPDGSMQWFESLIGRGIKPGLDNTEELLGRLGNPQNGMRYIHVAGTDGKGSVCAMTESVLRASGMHVGAFTSPQIMRVNECIRMDGEEIPDRDLIQIIGVVRPHADAMAAEGRECSSFEVLTAMALLYFTTVSADIAIIEVGMGGRLDSTNVITPEITVINNIGLEHTAFLGSTIEEVAYEKAGIMKPGVVCITSNRGPAYDVLSRHAEKVGCPLVSIADPEVVASWPDCIDMIYRDELYTVSLPGRHQARNAALVLEALQRLPEYSQFIQGHVREGLETVSWPCRMQKLITEPMVVDVSHTMGGAVCLLEDISEIYGKVVLVLGMLSDKDIDGFCSTIAPAVSRAYVAAPDSPRACPAETVSEIASRYMDVEGTFGTVADALDAAMKVRGDEIVLVTGSFRTAGDALRWIQSRYVTS